MGGRGSAYYEQRNKEKESEIIKNLKQSKRTQPYLDDPESLRNGYKEFKELKKLGFSVRESTDKFFTEQILPYQNQLILLAQKYNLSQLKNENELQLSTYRLNGAYGAMQLKILEDKNLLTRLTLDNRTIYDKEQYVKYKKYAIIKNQSVYVDEDKIPLYTITHEFGHIVEEEFIRKKYIKLNNEDIDYSKFREQEATKIKNEVINNLKKKCTTNLNNDKIYLSNYSKDKNIGGSGNDFEWFAETFTNLELSTTPAPIALELKKFLEEGFKK